MRFDIPFPQYVASFSNSALVSGSVSGLILYMCETGRVEYGILSQSQSREICRQKKATGIFGAGRAKPRPVPKFLEDSAKRTNTE
jgi:hypothetical protein